MNVAKNWKTVSFFSLSVEIYGIISAWKCQSLEIAFADSGVVSATGEVGKEFDEVFNKEGRKHFRAADLFADLAGFSLFTPSALCGGQLPQ